jgi:hypothetical protein
MLNGASGELRNPARVALALRIPQQQPDILQMGDGPADDVRT